MLKNRAAYRGFILLHLKELNPLAVELRAHAPHARRIEVYLQGYEKYLGKWLRVSWFFVSRFISPQVCLLRHTKSGRKTSYYPQSGEILTSKRH